MISATMIAANARTASRSSRPFSRPAALTPVLRRRCLPADRESLSKHRLPQLVRPAERIHGIGHGLDKVEVRFGELGDLSGW